LYGVAIASGKGGVGKSIVSSSIIQELASAGKTVGAIDADFSNSNLGRLLRINGDISITPEKRLIPVRQNGLSFFSMEQIAQDKGIAMTGEEYAEIIRDVLENGIWDVDYMVVDLPAVISNEFKSVLAYFEDNYLGTIIVAQPAHLTTTERVVKLHQINGVPIPGLVEDMVSFRCTHGEEYPIFGKSGIDELAQKYGVQVLGKIPISMSVQEQIQSGQKVRIPDDEVVRNIAGAILTARPQKLGFVQELKSKAKEISRDLLFKLVAQSILIINKDVNIRELQEKYSFPGGTTIGLVIMDDRMKEQLERLNFRIDNGKLVAVGEPKTVDLWIYIRGVALGWAILGKKKFPDGRWVDYDIADAWYNGDARVFGATSVVRAISFYRDIWAQTRGVLTAKLGPVIERLV